MVGKRAVTLNPNDRIAACPRCGNNTSFVAHSAQVAEDCCDVWVVCRCGFDPTAEKTGSRVEDVWGSLDNDTIQTALRWSWNDLLAAAPAAQDQGEGK